jgi:hypothetical protein
VLLLLVLLLLLPCLLPYEVLTPKVSSRSLSRLLLPWLPADRVCVAFGHEKCAATLVWLDVPELANEEVLENLVSYDVGYQRCQECQKRRETRCSKSSFLGEVQKTYARSTM